MTFYYMIGCVLAWIYMSQWKHFNKQKPFTERYQDKHQSQWSVGDLIFWLEKVQKDKGSGSLFHNVVSIPRLLQK